VAVELHDEAFQAYLQALPNKAFKATKQAFGKAAINVDSEVKSNFGRTLKSRTGLLRKSLRISTAGTQLNNVSSRVEAGRGLRYALLQEYGGTVRAKHAYRGVPGGPYLNIPIGENLTAAGVMRFNAKDVFNAGGHLIKSRKGNWLVMSAAGAPMFVLVKQVIIKPALGLNKAKENEIPVLLGRLRGLFNEVIA